MVNIGLALKELSLPKGEANLLAVNLNALPEVYKPKPISITKVFIVPSIVIIAVGLLIPMTMLVRDTAANITLLRNELDITNLLIEQRLVQKQGINDLELEVGEAEAADDIYKAVPVYIDDQRYQVNSNLAVAVSALPEVVDLGTISYASNGLTISGIAPSEMEVLVYAKKLRESGIFAQVTIAGMEKIEEGMSFSLVLNSIEEGMSFSLVLNSEEGD